MTFTAYTAPFGIDPDNEYIIYVRLTDNSRQYGLHLLGRHRA